MFVGLVHTVVIALRVRCVRASVPNRPGLALRQIVEPQVEFFASGHSIFEPSLVGATRTSVSTNPALIDRE